MGFSVCPIPSPFSTTPPPPQLPGALWANSQSRGFPTPFHPFRCSVLPFRCSAPPFSCSASPFCCSAPPFQRSASQAEEGTEQLHRAVHLKPKGRAGTFWVMSGKQLNRLINRQEGYQQGGIFNEADFQRAGGLSVLYHTEGSSPLARAVGSPWHKFLIYPPAPYSHRTSKVEGNAAALAAGCVSHCSLEQRRNTKPCQTEPPFFSLSLFLFKTSCNSSPSSDPAPSAAKSSSFGVIYSTSASEFFLSQGNSGVWRFSHRRRAPGQQDAERCPSLLQAGARRSKRPGKEGTGCRHWCTGPAAFLPSGRATLCSGRSLAGSHRGAGQPLCPLFGKSHRPHVGTWVTIWILAAAAARAGYCLPCASLYFCPLPSP